MLPLSSGVAGFDGAVHHPPASSASTPCCSSLDHVPLFSMDQMTFVCQCLENCSNYSALLFFVERIARHWGGSLANHPARDTLHRAKALSLFHLRQFGQMYAFIRRSQFAHNDHLFLQGLWNNAHYAEVEQLRGKLLDPVSRYRIRKKNGLPPSIWDGESTSYCFKKSARQILREMYRRQNKPSQEEKVHLAQITQLTPVQVSNWFKNQRQRARQRRQRHRNDQHQRDLERITCCSSTESDGGMESEEGQRQNNARGDGGRRRGWDDPQTEQHHHPQQQ